ncbi:MAG: TolC family protein [Ignavibacteriales bacterium]
MKKNIFLLFAILTSNIFAQNVESNLPGGLVRASKPVSGVENAAVYEKTIAAEGVIKLSLKDAIGIAMQKNKDILISDQDLLKAEAQINEAYGNAYPQLSFSANYSRNIELPSLFIAPNTPFNSSPNTVTFSLGANNSYTAGLSLSQVLFSAKVNTAIKIAKDYRLFTEYNSNAAHEDVALQVKRAYYGVLLSQNVMEVSQQSLELAKANYNNVSQLYKQGMASEFDYLRAEVQVSNTEPVVSQAQSTLILAKNGLKNILGIELNRDIELTGSLSLDEIPQDVIDQEGPLALQRNSQLQALSVQENILEKNIQIQRADYYPTLAAFGQYQYQSQDNTFRFSQYLWAKSFTVGLSVSYPIFNGMQTKYRTEQASIDKDKLVLTRMKLEEGIKIQVEEARLRMMEARKRIEAQGKSVEQATKAVSIAEVRFKNGLGTQIELIDSQVALTRTQINKAQAVYDYLIARSDWERITGYKK